MPLDSSVTKSPQTGGFSAKTAHLNLKSPQLNPKPPQATWHGMMRSLPREHGFEPLRIEGRLPAELDGTLYRNGAMQFDQFGSRYSHWFEGDGGVMAVRFNGSAAQGSVRLVETEGLAAERKAGKLLSSWSAPWLTRATNAWSGKMKVQANTNALPYDGKLLALMESGLPYELDPNTLETVGKTDLGGALIGPFSAHPHGVAKLNALFNIGVRYGPQTFLDFYGWPKGRSAELLTSVPLPFATMVHDFMATERHLIALVSPAKLLLHRALLLLRPIDKLFRWRPDLGTEVIVVSLDDPQNVTRFSVDPFWQWHFSNGFSDGDEVTVDFCKYDDLDTLWAVGDMIEGDAARPPKLKDVKGEFVRATIDVSRKTMTQRPLCDVRGEFPRIDPRRQGGHYRYAWMTAGDELGFAAEACVKVDTHTGEVRSGASSAAELPSEPVFVPRPAGSAEDDGWLLSLVYDGVTDTSHIAVADAEDPGRLLARAHFDHHIPGTFHGNWLPAGRS